MMAHCFEDLAARRARPMRKPLVLDDAWQDCRVHTRMVNQLACVTVVKEPRVDLH